MHSFFKTSIYLLCMLGDKSVDLGLSDKTAVPTRAGVVENEFSVQGSMQVTNIQ